MASPHVHKKVSAARELGTLKDISTGPKIMDAFGFDDQIETGNFQTQKNYNRIGIE